MVSTGWEKHYVPNVCTGTIGVANKTALAGNQGLTKTTVRS